MKKALPWYGYFGGAAAICAYLLGSLLHLPGLILQILGIVFAFGLLLLMVALNPKGSFFSLLAKKQFWKAAKIYLYGMGLGMGYELVGQLWLNMWYYPPIRYYPWVFALLPIFWGIFGVVVRECYIILERITKSILIRTLIVALILELAIEGVNLFTRSWVYAPINLGLLFLGWAILGLTFYVIPHEFKLF